MNEKKSDILNLIDHRDGMTVPDGFFDKFAAEMEGKLPFRAEAESVDGNVEIPKTFWHRIRPFVYLAAMFAGIWCMLKMFTLMTANGGVDLSIDGNQILTEALSDEDFVYEYIIDDLNQQELLEEMFNDSLTFDEMPPVDIFSDIDSDIY